MTSALHWVLAVLASLGLVTGAAVLLAYARWGDLP